MSILDSGTVGLAQFEPGSSETRDFTDSVAFTLILLSSKHQCVHLVESGCLVFTSGKTHLPDRVHTQLRCANVHRPQSQLGSHTMGPIVPQALSIANSNFLRTVSPTGAT